MRRSAVSRFRIEYMLGRGATAEVHAALTQDGRPVALKLGHCAPGLATEVRRCFQREVSAVLSVDSVHVPRALDWDLPAGETPYIAFERVQGRTLAEVFRSGPLPLAAVVDLGCQLARALHHVHRAGVIHCDVKPTNVLLAKKPRGGAEVKLVDFGISRDIAPAATAAVPEKRWTFGTPAYMSPEQILGAQLDPRTDVYSACVVLYMALTGRRPFAWSPDSRKVLRRVLEAPVAPPRSVRPDCPEALEAVLLRGLSRPPAGRMRTASALRAALERVAREHGLPRGAAAWIGCDLTPGSERAEARAA